MGLVARKAASEQLQREYAFSERRACGLVLVAVGTYRYCRRRRDEALRERLLALARERPRFGYRRLQVLLEREGRRVNHKRVHRLYCEAGLAIRRRKRKHCARVGRPLGAADPLGLMCPGGSCTGIEGEVLTNLETYGPGGRCSVNGIAAGCAEAEALIASGNVDLAASNTGVGITTAAARFTAPPGTSAAALAAAEQQWAGQFGTANFTACENAGDSATGYTVAACQVVALAVDSNGDPVLSGFQFFNPSADYRQFSFSTPYSPVEASARLQAAGYSPDTIDWVHGPKALNFRESVPYCSAHFVVDPAGPGVGGTLHVDSFNPLFFSPTSALGLENLIGHAAVDVVSGQTGAGCPAL